MLSNSSSRRRWGVAFFEVILIVVGVLLGLAVNEWRQSAAENEKADRALVSIKNELQDNYKDIQESLPYNKTVIANFDTLFTESNRGKDYTPKEFFKAIPKGFGITPVRTNAWDLAIRTGALNLIDYQLAADLANIYDRLRFYQSKIERYGDNIYLAENVDPQNKTGLLIAVRSITNDVVIQEQRLNEQLPKIIDRLEELQEQ